MNPQKTNPCFRFVRAVLVAALALLAFGSGAKAQQYYFSTYAGSPGVTGSADGTGSAARFADLSGVAVDASGNVYVTDCASYGDTGRIRKVTPGGVVTTLGGGSPGSADGIGHAAGFALPSGVAVDGSGNLYVADTENQRISRGIPLQVTGSAGGLSPGRAVVTGSANPHGLPATVWFEYGPTTAYTTGSTAPQATGSGSTFVTVSATLTGLASGTPYHYRLGFTNSEGTFYGTDRTCNGPGYTTNEAEVSATSVTLSASVNPNGYAGPSTNRTNVLVSWQYGLTSGSYTATTTATPIGTGTAAVSVSSIKANSALTAAVYHYRLIISSTLGLAYGPDQTFSVKPPTLVYPAVAVTGSNATVSPTVNPNGLATSVTIQYGLTTAYTSGTTPSQDLGSGFDPVTVTSGSLGGLVPNTGYHYRVVTSNALGTVYGADQTFATTPMYGTSVVVSVGDPAPGIMGAKFSVLGIPAMNDVDHAAFQAFVTGSVGAGVVASGSLANNSGLWADSGTNGRTLIVRTGMAAPGYANSGSNVGTFALLSDPVYANDDAVAFAGSLVVTGTVTTGNRSGIWATTSGSLTLVARVNDTAPDANGVVSPTGPLFATLPQFVLPDQGGVILLATLNVPTPTVPAPGGVTAFNNQGIWAVDTSGTLKQIIRKGDALTVNGKAKTILALAIFNTPTASTGQTRHFNTPGDLMYKATFTDGSISVVQSVFP